MSLEMFGGVARLSSDATQPNLLTQTIPNQMFGSPALSLSIKGNMDGHGEMGLIGDHFDPSVVGRLREDGYESRSGSENLEGLSGDDQDAAVDEPPKKKKYHRHTPNQIQELEVFFKECPHPDEKQRSELSRRLGLETKQIKFWFQNRRTQMKTQLERHENVMLRQENDKLRAENVAILDAMRNPICNNCGGPGLLGETSYEEHKLKIENVRLRDELSRICSLTNKFLGRPLSSLVGPLSLPSPKSGLELTVGRNGFGNFSLPMGLDLGDGIPGTSPVMPLTRPAIGMMGTEMPFERSLYMDLAFVAMEELMKMAQADSSLWIKSLDGGKEALKLDEYMKAFTPCIGMKPNGFVAEATRETGMVIINSLALVETLMDANRWADMFPSLIARASTLDIISSGMGGTRNGALQVMHAEFQVLSPLVPVRQVKFLRFCKQHAEGVWAVVDVSIDTGREGSNTNCRRLPSGCVVQDIPNGHSKVTWLEHSEYDESLVHHLYRPLLISGMGFGAQRWIASLQRQCECLAILMSSTIPSDDKTGVGLGGRKSMLKLAQRMMDNFCAGICASTTSKWDKLRVGNLGEDVRVMTRKSMDDPGEPPGIVLSAATSVWMPVTQKRLFDFLRNEQLRSQWDVLSTGGPIQEMANIAKGPRHGNCVSLLRASATNVNDNGMLILQETWMDASGSLVVYAPVDIPSINMVMNGGDSAYVALLPSGFAILPVDQPGYGGPANSCNVTFAEKNEDENGGGGCFLTVGFQILVNSLPSAKLTVESVETVNNLISCTVQKIKAALQVT